MPDLAALTCDFCRREPVACLLVYDIGPPTCKAPIRTKALICAGCSDRDRDRAREIAASASSAWWFTLTPAMETVDA